MTKIPIIETIGSNIWAMFLAILSTKPALKFLLYINGRNVNIKWLIANKIKTIRKKIFIPYITFFIRRTQF